MKTILSTAIISLLLFMSCNSNNTANSINSSSFASVKFKEVNNCDEFINQYEIWMDSYLEIMDNYMKNPMDATLMQDYLKIAEENVKWVTQWDNKFAYCASSKKFEERFNKINEKAEKRLNDLGIE